MGYFDDDNERIFDAQEGREYKRRAKEAFDKRCAKRTANFDKAWKSWRENSQKLDAYRQGLWKPEPQAPELDWGKVGYTAALQFCSLLIAAACIYSGNWPVVFLSIPAILATNIYFLLQDNKVNE